MARHTTLFNTHAEYEAYTADTGSFVLPNVSYCKDQPKIVHYNTSNVPPVPPHDYSQDYFTLKAINDCVFDFDVTGGISYSLDNGETWSVEMGHAITPTISAGEKVLWKGNLSEPGHSSAGNVISSTDNFEVEGNVMSLIYGDNFIGKYDITNDYIFKELFSGCTNLTSAENLILPATTLTYGCYYGMFFGCTSLTSAPELPATTLAEDCYYSMFYGCTSLTSAPELPATTLSTRCYGYMFGGCTSLVNAPELPATTLANYCYNQMFLNCTSLVQAPELPATTLANYCYQSMFRGCSSLSAITCLATDISASNCTGNWVSGVSPKGIFNRNPNMSSWTRGVNGIPQGWTVQPHDYSQDYLTFKALNDNVEISTETDYVLFSKDSGQTWVNSLNGISQGDEIIVKGNIPSGGSGSGSGGGGGKMFIFDGFGEFEVYGNIMSLIYSDDFIGKISLNNCVFHQLFQYCTGVTSAENLILPATTLADSCYNGMFQGCTSLTSAPELPATTLARECYSSMFAECTSLTSAPELPATTLAEWCYQGMFAGCTSLTTAPELPATTLADYCYSDMFYCTSLTSAPELPATTLANGCYKSMFNYCSSLSAITCLATDISATDCTTYWLQNVSPTGVFKKAEGMTGWTTGINGIPQGWTVEDAS